MHNCEIIYQVGDFAAFGAYRDRFLNDCQNYLEQYNKILVFNDGNHDDHPMLRSLKVDEGPYRFAQISSRIFYVPRGTHWEWDGVRFCAMGGAWSIDAGVRTENVDWFPEEKITLGEAYKASQGGAVDIMFTHDAPYGTPCFKKEWHLPSDMQIASDHNRKLLLQIVENVKPKLLVHGHHHHYYEYDLTRSDKAVTHVIGLNFELHPNSMYVIDLGHFKKLHSIT